jgi:ATPase subunit of ABC transporter with duplicated ATPase domains
VLLVSHDRAVLDAVADRTLAIEDCVIRSYDGGWADYVRARDAREIRDGSVGGLTPKNAPGAGSVEKRPRPRPATPSPKGPSELEQVEARIAAQEKAVADLERKLADDWSDMEVLTAHRAARDELQSLLDRWETLFEQTHASP